MPPRKKRQPPDDLKASEILRRKPGLCEEARVWKRKDSSFQPPYLHNQQRRVSLTGPTIKDRSLPATTDVCETVNPIEVNPIEYWTKNNQWPKEYFKPEGDMAYQRLARTKASSSPSKQSESSNETSILHKSPMYEVFLAKNYIFMKETYTPGIAEDSEKLCESSLQKDQDVPRESLFSDDMFQLVCQTIESCGEFRITRDIGCLIVPSAENLALYKKKSGYNSLKCLAESVNELWANIPIVGPCPKPDYSLQPYIGKYNDRVYYKGTPSMLFPFLTCEVKSASIPLDVADRQNSHSTVLAMPGVVELFMIEKRQKELHRQILAFSVSHNHREVRIYGHFPFYRHLIREFDFTKDGGKNKWTAYKFIVSLFNDWAPTHFKRLC
ncbi:hypothetical protein RUND412_000241 [Rhizina undulata]